MAGSKQAAKREAPEGANVISDKEARFVEEYLVDMNGAQAAIRAGYSERRARQVAVELLARPRVQEALRQRQRQLSAEVNVTQRRVLNEYANIAFFRPNKLFDKDGSLIAPQNLPEDVAAAITSFKIKKVELKGAEGSVPLMAATTAEVKWHAKDNALRALGEHLGLFEGGVKDSSNPSHMTDDELEQAIRAEEEALALIDRAAKASKPVAKKAAAKAK